MTTTVTKTSIVASIKTEKLITYTLVHDQVQTNFKLIAEALSLNQNQMSALKLNNQKLTTKVDQISSLLNSLESRVKQQEIKSNLLNEKSNSGNQKLNAFDKKIEALKIQFGQFKEQDKASKSRQGSRINPEQKGGSNQLSVLNNQKLDNLMKITNAHEQMLQRLSDKTENNQKKIKADSQLFNKELETLRKQIISIGKASDAENIWRGINQLKEQLGDYKISEELQKIDERFKKYEQWNNNKINALNQQIRLLRQTVEQQRRLRSKISQQVWKMNDAVFKLEADKLDNSGINHDKFIDMEKDILDLKKKMELIFNMSGRQGEFAHLGNKTTYLSSRFHNTDTKITEDFSPSKSYGDTDLKAQMMNKMKEQKQELLKFLKKADHTSSENDKTRYMILEDAIKRLQHLINAKADMSTVKKLISHVENKTNHIFHMISNADQEDALIARKNWFCLSCDKKLETYKGSIGIYLPQTQQLKGEQIKNQIVGGGMSMRSKSKVDLPKVVKGKQSKS